MCVRERERTIGERKTYFEENDDERNDARIDTTILISMGIQGRSENIST